MSTKPLTDEQRKLVEDSLELAEITASHFVRTGIHNDYDELLSECMLALCEAAQRYKNYEWNAGFSTYAYIVMHSRVRYRYWQYRMTKQRNPYNPSSLTGDVTEEQGRYHVGQRTPPEEHLSGLVKEDSGFSVDDILEGWKSEDIITEREAVILSMRFVDGETLDAIGVYFDITGERVRQIVNSAIQKIRDSQ